MSKTKTHVIDARRCKSCGLCVDACPKGVLAIGTEINGQGYNYIERAHPEKCVLCNICGVVCPDVAVGVVEEWRGTLFPEFSGEVFSGSAMAECRSQRTLIWRASCPTLFLCSVPKA